MTLCSSAFFCSERVLFIRGREVEIEICSSYLSESMSVAIFQKHGLIWEPRGTPTEGPGGGRGHKVERTEIFLQHRLHKET